MNKTERDEYLKRLRGLLTELERTEKKITRRQDSLTELEVERDKIQQEIQAATLGAD